MKKTCVLGINGYLGSNFAFLLRKNGYDVNGVDVSSECFINDVDYQQADVCDLESLRKVDLDVDVIFDFAGKSGTLEGFEDYRRFVEINEIGLLNLLNIVKDQEKKPLIVFPSTRLIYKGGSTGLYNEVDDKYPRTIYAVNKLACENYLEVYRNSFNVTVNDI